MDTARARFQPEVLKNPGVVLVEFGAQWCGATHILAPVIDDLASEYGGRIRVFRVDVDIDPELTLRYGIRRVPALLLFRGGQLATCLVGTTPRQTLVAELDSLL